MTKPLKKGATYDDLRRVEAGRLEPLEVHQGNASVRARPFESFELELRALWI
jgi:hypothetical protein